MRIPLKNRNDFKSFVEYCKQKEAQDMRFWQALRNWSRKYYEADVESGIKPSVEYIFAGFDDEAMEDTFNWEDVGDNFFNEEDDF